MERQLPADSATLRGARAVGIVCATLFILPVILSIAFPSAFLFQPYNRIYERMIAAVLLAAVVLPHLLRNDGLIPSTGIALWTAVLALRAILVISAALTIVLYLPATQLFHLLTSWCLHAVLPFFATHLGFSGHRLGEMATLIPAVALALSLIVAVFSHWRAAHRVQAWLRGNAVGSGPGESVIVVEPEVMLAAAGVRKARVIVSAGALLALDEGELNAGIEHERGHIKRRHSYVSAVARVLYAVARGLPGTSRVQEQLTCLP